MADDIPLTDAEERLLSVVLGAGPHAPPH